MPCAEEIWQCETIVLPENILSLVAIFNQFVKCANPAINHDNINMVIILLWKNLCGMVIASR